MGNQCLATTPNEKYSRYLEDIKVSELKDLWQTVKVYKIKSIFEQISEPNPHYPNHTYLSFEKFKNMFPQLQTYPSQQVKRLYDFFDIDNQGFVDWNSFFSSLTICYFGSEKDLAVIMFMMFDHSLDFQLDRTYLKLMLQSNESYLKANEQGQSQDYQEVFKKIAKNEQFYSIQSWLKVAEKIIDFSKFRKAFNIFAEEKMEKQLVKHFHSWNTIFNTERDKYIGYLVNLKWFETWKLYIEHHYDVSIDIYNTDLQTINTIKTCKKATSKSLKNTNKLALESSTGPHGCRQMNIGVKDKNKELVLKDFDCIHGHLGQRPRQIANHQLQGEFQEILRDNLSQNMDYVIVSEQVWTHLKTIYGGYPEFRRTGFDSIELYPKVVCIYFSLFKGCIDYSSEVLRQVSSYLSVEQMLIKSCDVSQQDLNKKVIFYKTIGMKKWQLLEDASYLFTELSSQILIFLVCLSQDQKENFQKNHQKPPRDVTEANLGDVLIYTGPNEKESSVVFMGKSTEGKYILHFSGESYFNDICLMDTELIKHCKLSTFLQEIEPEKKVQSGLVGLPSGPGLGFINTVFIQLFSNKEVRKLFKMVDQTRDDKLFYNLAKISNLLSQQCRVDSSDLKLLAEVYLSKYIDFEVSMCRSAINDIFSLLTQQFKEEELPSLINQQYYLQIEKKIHCQRCSAQTHSKDQNYLYSLIIPEEQYYYFQIVWVPLYTQSSDILKYFIKVKKNSTLSQLMQAFQLELGSSDRHYVLTEVHGNDIVKNYNFTKRSATLQTLKLREKDKLYAYELSTNFNSFVSSHFSNREIIHDDQIKKDMFIDCKHEQKGWIFGKVIQLDYLPYTQAAFVKVMHKFNKNQSWEITYNCFEQCVARFPLKSHKNSQQYHIKLQQRCFNEAANSMQLVTMPLVVAIPAWMRWKQFFFFIYLQVRRFIAQQYNFDLEAVEQPTGKKGTSKSKGASAIDKFKEYKNSSRFPYSLRLVDYEGRCVICLKFVKTTVFKGQNQNYCEGCELSQSEPICWQVKPADLIICVDWKQNNRYKKDVLSSTKSANLRMQQLHRQQVYSLASCLNAMKSEYTQKEQYLCCNVSAEKKIKQKIIQTSDNLIIFVERIFQENDGFKRVVNRPLKLIYQGLVIENKKYNLTGLTSIEGEHFNIRYKTYVIKSKTQWYEYDGPLVRVVDTKHLEKQCALVLYYERSDK